MNALLIIKILEVVALVVVAFSMGLYADYFYSNYEAEKERKKRVIPIPDEHPNPPVFFTLNRFAEDNE